MSELKPMTAHRAIYFMERFKKEEKLLGPNEQSAVDYVIAMLVAQDAQPQQAEAVPWAQDDLDGMVEALRRVIDAHYNTKQPFHNPVYADARMAHRILVGYLPYMKYAAIAQQKGGV